MFFKFSVTLAIHPSLFKAEGKGTDIYQIHLDYLAICL